MKHGTIATDLYPFCEGCKEIEPVAIIKELDEVGGFVVTRITCKHATKCRRIVAYLQEKLVNT